VRCQVVLDDRKVRILITAGSGYVWRVNVMCCSMVEANSMH
jgi:hypothetical protein